MKKYRYIGKVPDTLGAGRPITPGDEVKLSADAQNDPHNQWLIEDGRLIELASEGRSNTKKKEGDS